MARRPQQLPTAPSRRTGPAINEDISSRRVLLIDETGEKRGEVSIDIALSAARRAGLDLVEVAPTANPPVVKILDFGKLRFNERKKRAAAKKRQKTATVKEIKMRPNIDVHDYEVKTRAIRRFFDDGDKVKVTLRFRGREMAHQGLGVKLLSRVRSEFEDMARIEQEPKIEGRQMVMVMSPR